MARTDGLNFKDLLDAQRKLAAAGDESAKKQIIRLESIAKAIEDETSAIKEVVEPIQETLTKGLVTEKGTSLNGNVSELAEVLKKSTESSLFEPAHPEPAHIEPSDLDPVRPEPVRPISKPTAAETRREQESRLAPQAAKYLPGGSDWVQKVKMDFGFNKPKGLSQGFFKDLKRSFDPTNLFQLEGGKSLGLLGDVLRQKAAKNQFIEDELATKPQNKALAQYQKKDAKGNLVYDEAKHRADLAQSFTKANEARGEIKQTTAEISRLREAGYDENQIARTKLHAGLAPQEEKLIKNDPMYRKQEQQKAEEKNASTNAKRAATIAIKKAAAGNVNIVPVGEPLKGPLIPTTLKDNVVAKTLGDSKRGLIGGYSKEATEENAKFMADQTDTLKKIEENTRASAAEGKDKSKEPEKAQPEAKKEDGGILGSITDVAGNAVGKLGGIAKTAGRFLGPATAVAGAGYAGYKAGQWLNENTGIQSGIASGIDAAKGWFGNSDEDKMKESTTKANRDAYDKRVSEGKLTEKSAKFFESQGVKVDRSKIVASEASPIAPTPTEADTLTSKSAENAAAASPPIISAPTIINAPKTSNVSQQTSYSSKPPARNTDSTMKRQVQSMYAY